MEVPGSPVPRHRSRSHYTESEECSSTTTYVKWSQLERRDVKTGEIKKSPRSIVYESEENEADVPEPQVQRHEEQNLKKYFIILPCIVGILLFLLLLSRWKFASFDEASPEVCKFHGLTAEDLTSRFRNQPKDLSFIIRMILEEDRNSVDSLVLLHSTESDSTARCLARKLTETYAYNKRNECSITTIDPYDVNTADDDYGEVLNKYIWRQNGTAAVVRNLLEITPNKAQIFHTMCDDTIPRNIPSLLVFTLLSESDSMNLPRREARNILSSAWKDLPDNVLDPLLARILGHVVQVSPEKELPC